MAGSSRGLWARLVDWFTIEIPEPEDVQPAPPDADAREWAPLPPAAPAPPRAGAVRRLLAWGMDWLTAGGPEPEAAEGDAAAGPEEGQPAASPGDPRVSPIGALALVLGSLVELGAVVRAEAAVALRWFRSAPLRVRAGRYARAGHARQRAAAAPTRHLSLGRVALLLAAVAVAAVAVRLAPGAPRAVDGPAVPSAGDIASARAHAAAAAAATAAAAARDASAAGQKAAAQLSAARQAARQVAALATPALARLPSARDPAKPLATLQLLQTQAAGIVGAIGHDVRAAEAGAAAAAPVAASARQAAAAASSAKSALSAAQGAAHAIAALLAPAQHAAAAWRQIHAAPPGTLGVTTRDPPAAWGVRGCEVLTVASGGAGQQLGLTGVGGSSRPVGDVVTLVRDATDGGASWPTASCADLKAAMAQSRAGDRITVSYEHRATVDLLLGFWLSDTGTVVLGQGSASRRICPPPLTGRLGAGGTVPLTITLSGPAGTRHGVAVTLDPAGAASFFPDALLQALGYRPYQSEAGSGVVPGSHASVHLYELPGSSLTVEDGGQPVALAGGVLPAVGIPGGSAAGLGAAFLGQGAQLARHGTAWSLTPPCR